MKFKASVLLFAFLVVACGSSEPQPMALPVSEGVDYQVSIKTFDDGVYADQPFYLFVRTKDRGNQSRTVLRVEQCKDVAVAQTQDILYVFYHEIVLDAFSSFQYEKDQPRIMLCDMHLPICVHIQTELTARGTQFSEVRTYQTSWRPAKTGSVWTVMMIHCWCAITEASHGSQVPFQFERSP